jgi:hypothetical protein
MTSPPAKITKMVTILFTWDETVTGEWEACLGYDMVGVPRADRTWRCDSHCPEEVAAWRDDVVHGLRQCLRDAGDAVYEVGSLLSLGQ